MESLGSADVATTNPTVSRERALAHESRVRLLGALHEADGPRDAAQLAEAIGLHVNTVRSHLSLLEDAGLVERQTEARSTPGRPRVLYVASDPRGPESGERYQLMAQMLASYIASHVPDPAAAAEETGRQWGRHLVPTPPPFSMLSAEEGRSLLLSLLDQLGFAPRPGADPTEVELRHCPFQQVAEAHPEVACSLHLGLMRGAMSHAGAPLSVEDLIPFAEPGRCITHVVADDA